MLGGGHNPTSTRTGARSRAGRALDFVTFPLRGVTLFEKDLWGLLSLESERYRYVAEEVRGRSLDVGCRHNRFVTEFLGGEGVGIDVCPYEGLTPEQVLADPTRFPFDDASFDTVTFIACINHVPSSLRDAELAEAFRCLKGGGNVVVTMGNPVAEVIVHLLVRLYDRLLGTTVDMDGQRGMHEEEAFYLLDSEIRERLRRAGFVRVRKRYFVTEWWLNHMLIAWKP